MRRNQESGEVSECGDKRKEYENILGYRRSGSLVEDQHRLRERG